MLCLVASERRYIPYTPSATTIMCTSSRTHGPNRRRPTRSPTPQCVMGLRGTLACMSDMQATVPVGETRVVKTRAGNIHASNTLRPSILEPSPVEDDVSTKSPFAPESTVSTPLHLATTPHFPARVFIQDSLQSGASYRGGTRCEQRRWQPQKQQCPNFGHGAHRGLNLRQSSPLPTRASFSQALTRTKKTRFGNRSHCGVKGPARPSPPSNIDRKQ